MEPYTEFVRLSDVGEYISNGWGWEIEVDKPRWDGHRIEVGRKAGSLQNDMKTNCLLAHIASKINESPISPEQFERVRQYREWIEAQYQDFMISRETKHGKCPIGIKASIRNSMQEYSGSYSRYYKDVECGKIQFFEGSPYYYGNLKIHWCLKNMMKHCVRGMGTKVRAKYDTWMKSKPTPTPKKGV